MAAKQTTYHPIKDNDIQAKNVDVTGVLNVTGALNANGGINGNLIGTTVAPVTVIAGDGAVTIVTSHVALTKGSAAAITLAAPTAVTHDGIRITIYSESAFAHVITGSVDGFNAKGSSGTITFAANKGSAVTLVARNGHWYTTSSIGATVA